LALQQGDGVGGEGPERHQAKPLGVGAESLKAGGGAIDGPHLPPIPHAFRAVGGLAAGGGAGIKNPFPGLGIQEGNNALGLAVLHAPVALGIARQGPRIAGTIQQGDPFRQARQGGGPHTHLGQPGDEAGRIGPREVDPQIEGRRGIGGLTKHLRLHGIDPMEELGRQPEGEGMAQGQGRRRVFGQGEAPPGGGFGGQALPAPRHGPQEAVHHGAEPFQAPLAGEPHRGVHRGGGGDPLKEEELIKAHMEQPPQLRGLPLGRQAPEGGDPAIEQGPLTDGAADQIRGEGAIARAQGGVAEGPIEGGIGVGAGGHGLKHGPSKAAGRQTAA